MAITWSAKETLLILEGLLIYSFDSVSINNTVGHTQCAVVHTCTNHFHYHVCTQGTCLTDCGTALTVLWKLICAPLFNNNSTHFTCPSLDAFISAVHLIWREKYIMWWQYYTNTCRHVHVESKRTYIHNLWANTTNNTWQLRALHKMSGNHAYIYASCTTHLCIIIHTCSLRISSIASWVTN